MVRSRINNRYRIIMGLSNINADFLQLILCMFVSHALIDKPWFGAVLFVFMHIWLLYFQAGLQHIRTRHKTRMFMWALLAVSLVIGIGVTFIYPIVSKRSYANYVSFFVGMVGIRTYLTYKINAIYSKRKASHRWYKILFQTLFFVPCVLYAMWLFKGSDLYIVTVGFLITGVLLSFQRSTLANFNKYSRLYNDDMQNIFSYRMFSNMSLYSNIAISLGVLTYICYAGFTQTAFNYMTYLMMALWLFILLFFSHVFTLVVKRQGIAMGVNVFILGAAFWILGSVRMFGVNDLSGYGIWTLFWAFGLACISASLTSINHDFKMVADIADRKINYKDLQYRSLLMQVIGIIIASCIILVILAVWEFLVPTSHDAQMPILFRNIIIQLPALFMLISIVFALKQPLDRRNREKLMNYYRGNNQNKSTQENLSSRLVNESSVRFGVKIIAFLVKPFLRLRVLGKHNMDASKYPSIFVCNHGIFYGPIAAVIYLPTYFRPWVDKKMVDLELCTKEAYNRWIYAFPLPPKAKWRLARFAARIATWAINAFNPVPVERDNLRKVMTTFEDTVKALSEGDNVLIFPERPKRVTKNGKTFLLHETDSVGDMFSGFANIGRLYYQATGKTLRFYPVYANHRGHTFKIGVPVEFDPEVESREERQRIADYLREQMLVLRGEEGYDTNAIRKDRKAERRDLKHLKREALNALRDSDTETEAAPIAEPVVSGTEVKSTYNNINAAEAVEPAVDFSGLSPREIRRKYRAEIKEIRRRQGKERRELRPVIREDRKKARLERKVYMLAEKGRDRTATQIAELREEAMNVDSEINAAEQEEGRD